MRIDPLLDSVYLLGALWGGPGSQVCPAIPYAVPGAVHEVDWSLRPRVSAGVTAFVDVNVVPMDSERVLPNQIVLVEGGRITALGPASQVKVPAGAVRIDGRGKYLMPGLNDMHVHALSPSASDFEGLRRFMTLALADGVTAIRHLTPVPVNMVQVWQKYWEAAERPVPRVYWAPEIELDMTPDSAMGLVAAARAAGYDHISARETWEAASSRHRVVFDSVVAATRRAGLPFSAHAHNLRYEAVLEMGKAGGAVEHLYPLMAALRVQGTPLTNYNQDEQVRKPDEVTWAELRALAATIKRTGLWVTPTLHCSADRRSNGSHTSAHTVLMLKLAKALHDEGVGLLLAGDEPRDVRDDLIELVNAGLTPYDALRVGTYNVAQYMRLLDSTGTVTVGKRADLVLLYGNPLTDIRHTREPAGVMVAGRWLDRVGLDQLLMDGVGALPANNVMGNTMAVAELREMYLEHRKKIRALADSVTAASSSDRERMLRQMVEEFGLVRLLMSPQQRDRFDPRVRVWLRQQARQGYRLAIPGVSPVPLSN